MDLAEGLGYLASGLVVGTFCMKTMMPLRIVAIGSNFAFIAYSLAEGLLPIFVLHSILLPLNALRLVQMQKLLRRIQEAAQGDLALEGLLPFMTRRKVRRGAILFRKGELGARDVLRADRRNTAPGGRQDDRRRARCSARSACSRPTGGAPPRRSARPMASCWR